MGVVYTDHTQLIGVAYTYQLTRLAVSSIGMFSCPLGGRLHTAEEERGGEGRGRKREGRKRVGRGGEGRGGEGRGRKREGRGGEGKGVNIRI